MHMMWKVRNIVPSFKMLHQLQFLALRLTEYLELEDQVEFLVLPPKLEWAAYLAIEDQPEFPVTPKLA